MQMCYSPYTYVIQATQLQVHTVDNDMFHRYFDVGKMACRVKYRDGSKLKAKNSLKVTH